RYEPRINRDSTELPAERDPPKQAGQPVLVPGESLRCRFKPFLFDSRRLASDPVFECALNQAARDGGVIAEHLREAEQPNVWLALEGPAGVDQRAILMRPKGADGIVVFHRQ